MKKEAVDCKTPLHLAAVNGHLDVVQYLVEQGANKEATDDCNKTPLFVAAKGGHLEVVQYLVEQGVNKDATDADTRTRCWRIWSLGGREVSGGAGCKQRCNQSQW